MLNGVIHSQKMTFGEEMDLMEIMSLWAGTPCQLVDSLFLKDMWSRKI